MTKPVNYIVDTDIEKFYILSIKLAYKWINKRSQKKNFLEENKLYYNEHASSSYE
ncbi:MAG: hypothetical protein ACYDIA_16825 [Candidatus Humimicrobiaceae bacterium]